MEITIEMLRAKEGFEKVRIVAGGCWVVSDKHNSYSTVQINRKARAAYRAAYEAFHGEIPRHLVARHVCANKACVRPHANHVAIGTHQQNVDDMRQMIQSGRQVNHWKVTSRRQQIMRELRGAF